MAFTHATIDNCKTASIRKRPWIPIFEEEVVGELKRGSKIEVNLNDICYDWQDRKFYRTKKPDGWIHEGVIKIGGDS